MPDNKKEQERAELHRTITNSHRQTLTKSSPHTRNGATPRTSRRWENFSRVVDRAMLACQNSGFDVSDRFPDVRKTINMPKSAEKQVVDYKLAR